MDNPKTAKPMPPHGTNRRYVRGCRCDRCRKAHNAYERERRKARRGPPRTRTLLATIDPDRVLDADRFLTKEGYVRVRSKKRNEHLLVMEAKLGRALRPGETVHHRNGIRHDNDPANLELWANPHPSGRRVTDLVEWAKALLAEYEQDLEKL